MPNPDQQDSQPSRQSEQDVGDAARSPLDRLEKHTAKLVASRTAGAAGGFGPRRFAMMGVEFLGVVLVFAWIGHWLDGKFGWPGYAAITCIVLAVIGELYLQIKMLLTAGKK